MKKGFMHVVEIILVAILVFFVFTQFSSIPSVSTEWSDTKLSVLGDDILSSLESKGIDWFSRTEVQNELDKALPKNMINSVFLENVIKPEIRIGCLCKGHENDLEEMLKPGWFIVNDVNVSFETEYVNDLDELFSLDYDVAVLFGNQDLEGYKYPLRNFLNYGKGIVEIADIDKTDSVQETVFGLNFSGKGSDNSNIEFTENSRRKGKEVNTIYKYFHAIPLFHEAFSDLENWVNLSGNPVLDGSGNPGPSVKLTGNGCYSGNTFIHTKFYESFERGEIDFDVYLESGALLFVDFGKYLASLSANESMGYDSFYDDSMNPVGSNTSHLTGPWKWNHIKILVSENRLTLYNNGGKVATSTASGSLPSNISIFNRCGEAYADNVRITHEKDHEFSNFLGQSENITQIKGEMEKILLEQETGAPASIINHDIEGIGNGRTVWLSDNDDYSSEEYATLAKSLICWAAGSKYTVIEGSMKRPVSSYIYKPLNKDMFQGVKIVLELGYLY
jgi:hypothetical protein